MKWLIGVFLAFALLSMWVRLAPAPVANWHDRAIPENPDQNSGYRVSLDLPVSATEALGKIHERALATPRTRVFAGTPDTGKVTYVTRSLIWGFPDYSTVMVVAKPDGSQLTIYGRLRFGRSDIGVNRKRIKSWVQVFDAIQQ